jgi:hypothetical protein
MPSHGTSEITSFFRWSLTSSRAIFSSWAESLLAVLVAQVRDGRLLDQIPLENGSLLVRAKASS